MARWALGHLHAGLVGQVLAVHQHRAFAVERCSEQLAVDGQTVAHCGQQVVHVVGGVGFQLLQPALLAPDGRLVHADRHHVELAALGGDVGRDALAQHAFFERDPLELDVGVGLLEVLAELLHLDHVAVVHGGNHEFGLRVRSGAAQRCRQGSNGQGQAGVWTGGTGHRNVSCVVGMDLPFNASRIAALMA